MHPTPSTIRGSRVLALAAVLALIGTMVLGAVPAAARRPANQVDYWLTVLHNNDGESKLRVQETEDGVPYAGVARFKTLVDRLKQQALTGKPAAPGARRGVVMLSSGDNFLAGADFTASLQKGVPFYDSIAMNLIGYDAIAIGNHEFDFGPEVLADFISGVDASVPFLSANLDVSAEPELASLAAAGRIAGSTVVKQRGELIGIIGATTPQLPNISSPRNVVVGEVAPAVQAEVASLTAMGVDKIILISHLQNINEDLELANQLSGIDVMIAGGGDELLANEDDALSPADSPADIFGPYPIIQNGIPIITTPGDYKYVGRLTVGFNAAGEVIAVNDGLSGPVRVMVEGGDAVPPDPAMVEQVVEPVEQFVADLAANVLATSQVSLNGERGSVDEDENILSPGVRNSETNLGNLTADSMLWQAQQKASEFGVDAPQVAMQNGGGIRNSSVIPPGDITELDTFEILAFTNFVSIKEDVSAAQFKVILETSVSEIGNGRFGQWAGVTFSYDPAAQGRVIDPDTCVVSTEGSRVQDVTVDGTLIFDDGMFVGPAGWTVDLATNDFTFRGGDCYDFGPGGFTTVGVTYQQALVNFLTDASGLNGLISSADYPEGGEGRIVRLP